MFTYIELENFKSFEKIRFDFKKTKTSVKNFIALYGENGSGKSNFVSSIELLSKMMMSYVRLGQWQELKKLIDGDKREYGQLTRDVLESIPINELNDNLKNNLKKCRMIDCDKVTKVKYGFFIEGKEGYYSVSFDENSILEEELYYITNKQRGQLYKIFMDGDTIIHKFSKSLFKSDKYSRYIVELIDMYWGKHSLLAILLGEIKDKNEKYIFNTISKHCLNVIDNLMNVFILCKSSKSQTTTIIGSDIKIRDFEDVEIGVNNADKKKQLDIIEKIIDDFFTQVYTDIVKVYYKPVSSRQENVIRYKLFVEKIIAGKVRVIPFELESAGTQRVLYILRAIIEAVNGQTVIYDEIDNGIHDLLMRNILMSVQDDITGQLIITTHNTLLLEDLDPKSAYVIYVDSEGYKEARCFYDYDIRIQGSNNQRRLYLNGVFGGIPYSSQIDCTNMHINNEEE